MAIVFEGTDRSGKSTMLKRYAEVFREVRGREPRVAHCDKDSFEDWGDIGAVATFLDEHDLVDRLFDSECVYSAAVRGKRSINKGQIALFRVKTGGHAVVFVSAKPDTIRSRYEATAGEDHYVDADKSVEVQANYEKFYADFPPDNFVRISGEGEFDEEARAVAEDLIERFTAP